MGLQISREGKVLVNGREPSGIRERIWAWAVMRRVDRTLKEVKERAGLTDEQKAALDREAEIRHCRRHGVACAFSAVTSFMGAAVNVYVFYTMAHYARYAMIPLSFFMAWSAWRDYRKALALHQRQRELIVEDVHDY